jgi:hypothetical protein
MGDTRILQYKIPSDHLQTKFLLIFVIQTSEYITKYELAYK